MKEWGRIGLPERGVYVACAMIALALMLPWYSAATTDQENMAVTATFTNSVVLTSTGCAPGVANKTTIGNVLPQDVVKTRIDCSITFGANNDTTMLRLYQSDLSGDAMFKPSTGKLDTAFDGASSGNGRVLVDVSGASPDRIYSTALVSSGAQIGVGASNNGTDTALVTKVLSNGNVDTAFDGDSAANGIITLDVGAGADAASDVAIDPSGNIVVAGKANDGTNDDFLLMRMNSTGALDTTFDGDSGSANGKVTTDVGSSNALGLVIALQPDGKILVAGKSISAANWIYTIVRYNNDGTLDKTFDGDSGTANGKVTVDIGAGSDEAFGMALQSDGKIVVVGTVDTAADDIGVIRLNSDGTLDTGFDGDSGIDNGKVTVSVSAGNDGARDVLVTPSGQIVIVGYSTPANQDFAFVKMNANGSLDTSFDGPGAAGNGKFSINVDTTDTARAVMFLNDRILVGGDNSGTDDNSNVIALNDVDGGYDTTFDGDSGTSDGLVSVAGGTYRRILNGPDGAIYTAGDRTNQGAFDVYDGGDTVNNYSGGVNDWDQGSGAFGACMTSVTSATASWTTNATCQLVDGAHWNAIASTPTKIAYTTSQTEASAVANLRFALRPGLTDEPGDYVAPITFEAVSPNV